MSKKKKASRGGARPGAGRQIKYKVKTVLLTATVPADLRDKLDVWAKRKGLNRSESVVEALRRLTKSIP